MKKNVIYFLIACFSIFAGSAQEKEMPPKGGEPKDFTLPEKEVVTYDNGLKLVMIPYGTIPLATIQVVTKTGRINENEDQVWLTNLIANLLKEGSTNRTASEVANEIARMGGNLNVGIGLHTANVNSTVLYEFAPDAIALIADVLKNPGWPESELDRLKNDLKRNLSVSLSSPQAQARRDFYRHMYPDHSYGRIFPSQDQIDSYTIGDIRNFYEENFGAQRTTVYVAGTFDRERVLQAVETNLASWRSGTASAYEIAIPAAKSDIILIDRPEAPQSSIMMGLPTIDPTHEDYVAMEVANSLLGGSFASRITSNIEGDKGFAYSPYSILESRYRTGLWMEIADVTSQFTGASIKEIISEIKRLQNEPPSKEELEGIVNYESGFLVLRNSVPAGIISQLVFLDMHDLEESFLRNKISKMHRLTPEDIQETTRKYIRPEDLSLVVVGDKSIIEVQVQETMKQ